MITLATPIEEINRQIEEEIKKSSKNTVERLFYIGESAVNEARKNGDYLDHTGNLRSSIGYVVLNNGKVITMNTQEADRGTDRKTGVRTAEQFIQELSKKYNKGYVLIVVAGMDYAAEVEARGRNVISSSKLLAEILSKKML